MRENESGIPYICSIHGHGFSQYGDECPVCLEKSLREADEAAMSQAHNNWKLCQKCSHLTGDFDDGFKCNIYPYQHRGRKTFCKHFTNWDHQKEADIRKQLDACEFNNFDLENENF